MPLEQITSAERTSLLEHLQGVHFAITVLVDDLSPEEWARRHGSGNWSPAEILEHTLLVDEEILTDVRGHLQDAPSPSWEQQTVGKEAILRRFLPNIGRAQASAKTSKFKGLRQQEVKLELDRKFHEFSELLEQYSTAPLNAILWPHAGMGPLSASLWLLYIPLHTERHLNQLMRLPRNS